MSDTKGRHATADVPSGAWTSGFRRAHGSRPLPEIGPSSAPNLALLAPTASIRRGVSGTN
jgi:hypothetical protein